MFQNYNGMNVGEMEKLNFSGPEFVFAKFWEVLEKSSGS